MLASKRVKRRRAQIQAARQSPEEIESATKACALCSMWSSYSPSDLMTVIVCVLGISLVYKRQSADFKRLFKLIPLPISRCLHEFCSNVLRWPHRDVQTTAHLGPNRNSINFNGAFCDGERARSSRDKTVIFLQQRIFALFRQASFMPLPISGAN
jgi:hypothetical protein